MANYGQRPSNGVIILLYKVEDEFTLTSFLQHSFLHSCFFTRTAESIISNFRIFTLT